VLFGLELTFAIQPLDQTIETLTVTALKAKRRENEEERRESKRIQSGDDNNQVILAYS
jgi:hypothetical protein